LLSCYTIGGKMTQKSTDLLLSEVQRFNPSEFTRCKVHYDGFAGKGRDWQYASGGDSFEYEITPQQANLLSILQEEYGGRQLLSQEQTVVNGIPDKLVREWRSKMHVTGSAQVALYDLLN